MHGEHLSSVLCFYSFQIHSPQNIMLQTKREMINHLNKKKRKHENSGKLSPSPMQNGITLQSQQSRTSGVLENTTKHFPLVKNKGWCLPGIRADVLEAEQGRSRKNRLENRKWIPHAFGGVPASMLRAFVGPSWKWIAFGGSFPVISSGQDWSREGHGLATSRDAVLDWEPSSLLLSLSVPL